MTRTTSLVWLAIALILILPTTAGRIIIDLAGGLFVLILALPLLLGGAGWIGWKFLQSRLIRCQSCGANILSSSTICPICGSSLENNSEHPNMSIPASSATVDITAEDRGLED